jgi:hypothetical protein
MRPDGNTCPEQDRPFPHLPPDALNPGMLDAAIFHRERFGFGDGSILRSTAPIAMLVSLTRCRTPCFQAATIAIAATRWTLVVTQPSQKSEDASLILAIAHGTCWFEELTSGKAPSISGIASRENLTDSYVSRLLNLALLSPTIVDQVLNGNPAATEIARHEMTGRRLSALWREQ